MAKKAATDTKVMGLINEVNRQKAEIAKCDKPTWRTNMSFGFAENKPNELLNLRTVNDVRTLILVGAFVQEKGRAYKEASALLGVDSPPEFTWCGFTVTDWIEDLKLLVTKIQISAKRKKLEALESRLSSLVSPEMRAELELAAIANELNS